MFNQKAFCCQSLLWREGGLAILALVGRWNVFGHHIILLIQVKRSLCVVVRVLCTVLCFTTNVIAQKFPCSVNYTSVKISDLFTCTAHSKAYAGGCLSCCLLDKQLSFFSIWDYARLLYYIILPNITRFPCVSTAFYLI